MGLVSLDPPYFVLEQGDQKMTKQRSTLAALRSAGSILVAVLAVSLLSPHSASARPAYKSAFEKLYPKFKESGNKVTCAVCHPGKSKKTQNHYCESMTKALKKKNEKDKEAITEALKKIEDGECPDGTKWMPRLEKGELPCTHDESEKRHQPPISFIQRLLNKQ